MATANKKAGAAKKAVTKNPSAKKPVKTTAKKSAPQPKKASKPVGKNQKPAAKASSGKPSSSTVKKANNSKSATAKSPVVVKKATGKTGPVVKSKNSPAKSVSIKQASSKKPVQIKGASASARISKPGTADVKSSTVKPNSAAKQLPAKSVPTSKATTGSPKPATKASGKPKQPEQQDPLHTKAQKAIRELEETMDLSKMRPRIQAGSPAPKPLPKKPQAFPKLPEPVNTGGKVKYQLEFEFRSSPKILFTSLSDSSGLAGWFADEVHTKDDLFTFVWEGGESYARLIALHEPQLVRFQWLEDAADGTYFQFEIKEDDITSDIALVITDFAYPGEKDTNIRLWESQVQKLRMLLGSL